MSDLTVFDNTAAYARAGQQKMSENVRDLQQAAGSKLDAKTLRRIDEVSQDFEANFMSEMLKPMFEGLKVDETFGGGKGEEVFRGFLVQEYGRKISEAGGIGIASMVREQLIKQQEAV